MAVPRKEGLGKVTGRTQYVDDLSFPDMIYGVTVRSTIPRGKIQKIHFDETIPWEEFTIVKAADIPGNNYVALIEADQPYLASTQVNHQEEPILLLAHKDKYLLEEARRAVRIDYEPLPAVLDLSQSRDQKQIVWGEDNVLKSYKVEKGSVDEVWEKADLVFEGDYETGAQEQLYIENNGMIAKASPGEGVTVWGSMQCPYYIHKALVELFNLPTEKIRVVQAATGGGFGGKEEYPSILAGHAALLAWKAGVPVKMMYDRAEDMVATTKRHPSQTHIKSAFKKDGTLLGTEIDFVIDGGAYATLSSVVLSRGTLHAAGPYHCDHVRINSKAMATNLPPHGAFRGFGAPQSIFAFEKHLDQVAQKLNLDPVEVREKNFIQEGQTLATGQVVKEKVELSKLLKEALTLSDFHVKQKKFQQSNQDSPIKKGMGLATFMHGSGFTGSGEKYLKSRVKVGARPDGRVSIYTSSTEIGQGKDTIFSQIASQALNIPYEDIVIEQPDTARVPNSGPTVASRTCMIVGKLVEDACKELKEKLSVNDGDFKSACENYFKANKSCEVSLQYEQPQDIHWDDQKYQGDAYGAYAWAVYVAEVSVDTNTFDVRVDDFVALQDVGKVVHPVLAAGQIEGGVAQGIGYALYEEVVWKDGKMANNRMTNYIMPTTMDLPTIRVFFEEWPYHRGPFGGAKGLGELPLDGPAPAILNAVEDALGQNFSKIPLTPQVLMETWEGPHGS